LHVPLNRVDILSIGTTSEPFSGRSVMKAGAIGWLWGGIIDLLMHTQAQGTIALAKSLIGRPRMLRIDEELAPGGVSLDNVSRIPELKAYGNDIASDGDLIADVKARFFNGIKVAAWSKYP
jgi:hypothetical protein